MKKHLFLVIVTTIIIFCITFSVAEPIPLETSDNLSELQQKAEAGDVQSQYDLANMHIHIKDKGSRECDEAIKWYTKAAEQGHADAQNSLGNIYYNGILLPRNKVEAAKWYTKAAEQGHVEAQTILGLMYFWGMGGLTDRNKAFEWTIKAAEQDFGTALLNLGFYYKLSNDRFKDISEAAKQSNLKESTKWYTRAAEQGCANGAAVEMITDKYLLVKIAFGSSEGSRAAVFKLYDQSLLEKIALEAEGPLTRQDAVEKLRDIDLLVKISTTDINESVRGAALDKLQALEQILQGQQGNAEAQYKQGLIYHQKFTEYIGYDSVSRTESIKWFSMAAEQGHVEAQYKLGLIYQARGTGAESYSFPSDDDMAVKWYTRAAEQGHAKAQYELGRCYEYGEGTPKDRKEAIKWYSLAALQGHEINHSIIESITDQTLLKRISLASKDSSARATAVKNLTDLDIVARIAVTDKDRYVRKVAVGKITNQTLLTRFALEAKQFDVRIAAIEKLTDQKTLKRLASTDPTAQIRIVAIKHVEDNDFLLELSSKDSSPEVRFAAVLQITTPELLTKVAADSYYHELREVAKSAIKDSLSKATIITADQLAMQTIKKIESTNNQRLLADMSIEGNRDEICFAAVSRLEDQGSLATVAAMSTDREVTKVALSRLTEPNALEKGMDNAIDPAVKIAIQIKLNLLTWQEAFEQATQPDTRQENLGDVLAAVSLLPDQVGINYAVTNACLAMIRRGDESRIPELVDLLHSYGEKALCEDYLNCGQPDLDTAGRNWAGQRGYSIGKGDGSARARWGGW